jgi:hypothetical protein
VTAQLPDAESVMNNARESGITGAVSADIALTIVEKNGSKRIRKIMMSTKSFPEGVEKRFIRFIDPPDVKGTSMLIFDYPEKADEMWIYLPALKKTRRIISSEKGKSFMNSEFTNADMSSPPVSDFSHKHITGSGIGEQYIIESTPSDEDKAEEYGYSRKVSYINKSDFQAKKIEFYNFDNELFKVIEIKEIRKLKDGKNIVTSMSATNNENGRKSEFVMDHITEGNKVDDSIFTLQNLER